MRLNLINISGSKFNQRPDLREVEPPGYGSEPRGGEPCPSCGSDVTETAYAPSMYAGQDASLHCLDCGRAFISDPFKGGWHEVTS